MDELDFDVCVYCQADGCESGTAVHAPDCPSSTGVFPVTLKDLGGACAHCGEPPLTTIAGEPAPETAHSGTAEGRLERSGLSGPRHPQRQ